MSPTLAEVEQRAILEALEQTGNNMHVAAKLLGIGKTTLYRKVKQMQNHKPGAAYAQRQVVKETAEARKRELDERVKTQLANSAAHDMALAELRGQLVQRGVLLFDESEAPPQKEHYTKPRKPEEPIVSAAEIKRRQEVPAEPSKPEARAETTPKGLNLRAEREALLQIIRELREVQENVKARRSDWGKQLPEREVAYLTKSTDVPDDLHKPMSFFSRANHYIRQAYDLTDVLDAREKFILDGGLAQYEHIGALLRIGWTTIAAMDEAFFHTSKKTPKPAASLTDGEVKEA